MTSLVSPIVDIILRLWTGCATQTRYLCKLQKNLNSLSTTMKELKEARDDVQRRVVQEEADLNEPKKRTEQVRGWIERVQIIEGEIEVILQKADKQLSIARCLGVCCPPNNCWSSYKLGKSIAKKIPLVKDLKVKGDFQELTFVVARPTNYLSVLQYNKILLGSAMDELKNVRNDVQRKVVEAEADQSEPKMRTDQVRGWLQSVENIEGEVEVILQTSDEQLSNAECHEKDKLVVMKMASVDKLKAGKGLFQELTYTLPLPRVEDINRESPVGMESMFDEVWRLINDTYDKQPVNNIVGLYGPGGVGKTTLLEEINNEFKNKINSGEYGFDYVVIFVVVSKPVNYIAIQKKIGERLGLSDSLKEDRDEESRAQKILNALRNKNYALLLDDIWEDQFDKKRIGIPIHPKGNFKLIFTTRSERVCADMGATHTFEVKCLLWDKAWSLFQEKLGEKALNYLSGAHELELAKEVAKECGGLPLALITIGRAMSTKKSIQEWEDAITTLKESASKFPGMREKVLARLKLSYDNLSDETEKSCFRYCALFPEDHSIEIAQLVDYWIAEEGFLDGFDKLYKARNRGHTIIGNLKSACMLESGDEENHVKMHDVIRDMAIWIVNDCRSSDESGTPNNKYLVAVNDPCKKWENATRIFWDVAYSINNEEESPITSPNLHTLIMVRNMKARYQSLRLSPSFFQHMPLLRVLDLSNIHCFDDEFPISICELHELQYLNLSGTGIKELPVELRNLVKLKFLLLFNTSELRRIPAGLIANLSELQVLDIGYTQRGFEYWELKDGPSLSELDGLKQLQGVRITITSDVAFDKFLCNRKLQMVCLCLQVIIRSSSSSSSRRRVLDLSKFKRVKDLKLHGISEMEELKLCRGFLTDLTLTRLPKLNNILWTAMEQPNILCYIKIISCDSLKDLTWLVYMENLKELFVHSCEGLETIIKLGDDGFESGAQILLNTLGVFRSLELLSMLCLPKLKSICRYALAFPSIERIGIGYCPELKKLPLDSRSNINNTLQWIQGEEEWSNKLQWEDETIKSKFLPYFDRKVQSEVCYVYQN